jgi:hypothetical protein
MTVWQIWVVEERRDISETGLGGRQSFEILKLPHFLDNRLTAVNVSAFRPGRTLISRNIPGTYFCYRLNGILDPRAAE